jgi:hypothetical protein
MKPIITGVAMLGVAAGCASNAMAEGKDTNKTVVTHNVVATGDGSGENKTFEVRVEDDKVVKFIVDGKEVDPGSIDWSDGFVNYSFGDGENDTKKFFIATPDSDFDFDFEFDGEGAAHFFGDNQGRAVLGVRVEDQPNGKVKIVGLTEDGAAKKAGIVSGDIIVKLDGASIDGSSALLKKLGEKNPGDDIKVVVLREGDNKPFTVKLRGEGGEWNMRGVSPDAPKTAHFKHNENGWVALAPEGKRREHERVILKRLHEHEGQLRKMEEHLGRIKKLDSMDPGQLEKLEIELKALGENNARAHFDEHEAKALYEEHFKAKGMHGELRKGLEGMKLELKKLKELDGHNGEFAFGFKQSAGCDCDCEGCADCSGNTGKSTFQWAPKPGELKERMHVELRERAGKLRELQHLSKDQARKIQEQIEHAHKLLEGIEMNIDIPEIEVIIESLGDSDSNVVFVPDAPKMRSHIRAKLAPEAPVAPVAPAAPQVDGKHHFVQRDGGGEAGKLERESRLARFEERLERLERMLKKMMEENNE